MTVRLNRRTILKAGLAASAVAAAGRLPGPVAAAETIRILYTNDTHAHLEPFVEQNRSLGGVARRKALIDRVRALGGNTLLVDAGDVFQGTLYFNLYAGMADLAFFNALRYDATTIGNHEFDRGPDPLAEFIRAARFPVVSANIEASAGTALSGLVPPWLVRTVGQTAVGIVGLTTNTTPSLASPGPTVRFGDHYLGLQGSVDALRSRGVPVRLGLTHVGYDEDLALAAMSRGLGVIVGGHSHTKIDPTPVVVQGADGNPVLVVQAAFWGRYLGVLDVQFDDRGVVAAYRGALLPIDEDTSEDLAFRDALRPWAIGVEALRQKPAGISAVLLDGSRPAVRQRETNFGNLMADVMLNRTASDRTEIAFMNGGGIRDSIPAGTVSVGQILEVLPFGNTLVDLDLTGAQVVAALENGVSQVEVAAGRFPQVGGLRFSYDPARPAGSRVLRVDIGDVRAGYKPIDPQATYRIVTNDFMAGGGDGYSVFKDAGRNVNNSGILLADMLIEHFERAGTVTAALEGRIEASGRVAKLPAPDYPVLESPEALWRPGEDLIPVRRGVWAL